jgi:hypothetical protein
MLFITAVRSDAPAVAVCAGVAIAGTRLGDRTA